MSDIEELFYNNDNVLVFTNLDDIGQPYTCNDWGDRGVQFGGKPLITDDGAGSDLWGKFNTGSAFPSTVYIDHTMTVFYKANSPNLGTSSNIINQMLDKLYNSLLLSANFNLDFNNDVDSDGLINPGDSFKIIIDVMNKSFDEQNTALNVDLDLTSDCDDLQITSTNLGQIGNISSGETFQFEVEIQVDENVIIDDYFLNLVVTTDNIGDDGNLVVEEFSTNFSVTLNQAGFPVDVTGELISSSAIVDIDNDGENEIISSDKGGFIHIFEMDGSEWDNQIYPYETGDQNWGSPSIGNLVNNENKDVVLSSKNGQIYHISSSEDINISSIFNSGGFITATPALGDIDGDGLDEIIFGQYGGSQRLYAINYDGSYVDGFPYDLDEKVQRGVALSDFNGNNKVDIVVGTDDEFIHMIYDDGSLGWSYETGGDIRVAPSILELESGEKIILAGSKDDNFYGLNSDGTVKFIVETDDDISSEASILELDGFGPIIFFASGSEIFAIDSDGNNYGNWPLQIDAEVVSSIVFANVGMSSNPYLMFGDDSGKAHLYNIDGTSYQNFPINFDFPFKGSPTLVDTDLDGDLELIIGSTQNLVSIDLKEESTNTNLWNTHRSNMKRNGYFKSQLPLNIDDIIVDDFSIENVYPNPFNPSVTIEYSIDVSDFVDINIVDLQGKVIEKLESSYKSKGYHSLIWTPNNISSGVYLINIISNNRVLNHKLIFIK